MKLEDRVKALEAVFSSVANQSQALKILRSGLGLGQPNFPR